MSPEYRLRSIIDSRNLTSISELEASVKPQPSQRACTDDFNSEERQATPGLTAKDTGCDRGVLGCSISRQGCSAGNCVLYADAWFQSGHAESARVRPGFIWRPEV